MCLLLVNIGIAMLPNVKAPEQEKTWASSVSVTTGTATGILDNTVGQDGVFYQVAEEDVNDGRNFQNDTLNPDGTGTHTEWDAGIGPVSNCDVIEHWGCVNEGPPSPGDGNTSYVFHISLGSPDLWNDTYNIDDYTLQSGFSVDEVRIFGTALVDFFGDVEYATCQQSGASFTKNFPTIFLEVSYAEHSATLTTDPNTGLAWTEAGIDALEIGQCASDSGDAGEETRGTLVYAEVQSSEPLFDYTLLFQFDFTGIKGSEDPMLEIAGLRTGDTEAIMVQVLRSGTWITLSSDVFETTLTTSTFGLSTTDVLGGSASVRIIDSDTTDDTQTTVFIDEILILTGGKANNPSSAIVVETRSEYKSFENRLLIHLFWSQSGGPEEAFAIDKWVTVFIDGHLVGKGIFRVKEDHTFVPVPWGVLDGGMHNGTVRGFVLINWSTGPTVHSSVPEEITLDNFLRWLLIVTIGMVILIAVIAWAVKVMNERRLDKEMLSR